MECSGMRWSVGDTVKVKKSVCKPEHDWGKIKPGMVGTITKLDVYDPDKAKVDFPAQTGWLAHLPEMEKVGLCDLQKQVTEQVMQLEELEELRRQQQQQQAEQVRQLEAQLQAAEQGRQLEEQLRRQQQQAAEQATHACSSGACSFDEQEWVASFADNGDQRWAQSLVSGDLAMRAAMRAASAGLRQKAAEELGAAAGYGDEHGERVVAALADGLRHPDAGVRCAVVDALRPAAERGSERAVSALGTVLDDDDNEVRSRAEEARAAQHNKVFARVPHQSADEGVPSQLADLRARRTSWRF